jgi:hypothetical protein
MEIAMRMYIDGLDAFSIHRDGELRSRRLLSMRAMQKTAAAKENAGGGSRAGFEKIAARCHEVFSHRSCQDGTILASCPSVYPP